MHFLNVIFKIRHARRNKDYFPNFTDIIDLLTARIHYKFITVNIFYIILQFVNRAKLFNSFLIRFGHVTDVKKILNPLAFFGNRLYL
jgi:hypothetical protein